MAQKNAHTRDPRSALQGFTGLMHAAYSDAVDVFGYLFLIEQKDVTCKELQIKAPAISPEVEMALPEGATVLMVLLLRNSYQCLRMYLRLVRTQMVQDSAELPPRQQSASGLTALHICAMVSSNIGLLYLSANINHTLQDLTAIADDGMGVLHAVLYYKRPRMLAYLLQICQKSRELAHIVVFRNETDRVNKFKYQQVEDALRAQLTQLYNGYSCEQLSRLTITRPGIFRISDEDCIETVVLYNELVAVLVER